MKLRSLNESDYLDHEISRRLKNALAGFRPPMGRRAQLLRAAATFPLGAGKSGPANSLLSMILGVFASPASYRFAEALNSSENLRASYSTGVRLLGFTY